MTTLITRLFADRDTAAKASDALISGGFDRKSVRAIDGDQGAARSALTDMGVSDAAADTLAGKVAGGNGVVALRAPFGRAGDAISTLDRFDPVEVDIEQETHISAVTAPENALSIIPGNRKFLTSEDAVGSGTGFSESLGMPLLSSRQRGKAKVDTSTISKKFGFTLLSRKQGGKAKVDTSTISEKLGLKLIKKPRGGKSIVRNPTPFSSALGWPTIIRPEHDQRVSDSSDRSPSRGVTP